MNIKLENPKDIYDKINIELLKLVTSLSLESSDEPLHSTLWVDESEPYVFYPDMKVVGSDTKACCYAGNRM